MMRVKAEAGVVAYPGATVTEAESAAQMDPGGYVGYPWFNVPDGETAPEGLAGAPTGFYLPHGTQVSPVGGIVKGDRFYINGAQAFYVVPPAYDPVLSVADMAMAPNSLDGALWAGLLWADANMLEPVDEAPATVDAHQEVIETAIPGIPTTPATAPASLPWGLFVLIAIAGGWAIAKSWRK